MISIAMFICVFAIGYGFINRQKHPLSKTNQVTIQRKPSRAKPKEPIPAQRVFTSEDLKSEEFIEALEKIQNLELSASTPKKNNLLTSAEFETQFRESAKLSKDKFDEWANKNEDYFLKYKKIASLQVRELFDSQSANKDDLSKVNTAIVKLGRDQQPTPELIDLYIDTAEIEENSYAAINASSNAFYNLSTMHTEQDEHKFESCVKFLEKIKDRSRAQQLSQIFINANPNFNSQLIEQVKHRLGIDEEPALKMDADSIESHQKINSNSLNSQEEK
jgi:hypothetical protein